MEDSDDPAADAYNAGLTAEKAGDLKAAYEAYRRYLTLDPDDHGGALMRLASLGKATDPERAAPAYVATLFDQHAEAFDSILVDQLRYEVPMMLPDRLGQLGRTTPFERLLDLGCGTGLVGENLEPYCEELVAVDLSQKMVELAAQRGCYDDLFIADIVAFMAQTNLEPFDLVVAADVFPYLGALETFFDGLARVAAKNCVFAFSTEVMTERASGNAPYQVGAHQRFAHSRDYISECLSAAYFRPRLRDDIVVRLENGAPVRGEFVVAERS